MPGRILCYVMIIQWVVVHQSEQNDHRRDQRACALYHLCHAHLSVILCLRLLWTLCLLPYSGSGKTRFENFTLLGTMAVQTIQLADPSREGGSEAKNL
jgi:hypothetical protein